MAGAADRGTAAAGWELARAGIVRTVTPRRRTVLVVSLGVVALAFLVAVVVGLVRGLAEPATTILVLFGTAALVAYLLTAAELVAWAMSDRRGVAAVEVDPATLAHVQDEIAAGRAALVGPVERRALARFARVQQTALPATVLVHLLGMSVGVLLAALAAFGGLTGLVVVVIAVLVVALSAWSLRGALHALGSTPPLVALDG
jgi:hypothetical protein